MIARGLRRAGRSMREQQKQQCRSPLRQSFDVSWAHLFGYQISAVSAEKPAPASNAHAMETWLHSANPESI
jgi:hypothetical protein